MMHGSRVVPGTVLGLKSRASTQGHRFLASGAVALENADEYESALRDRGRVIASFDARKDRIAGALASAAGANAEALGDAALLDEVTALVEWPVVYEGRFDEAFLEVPQECLVLSMKQHQKYFPFRCSTGRRGSSCRDSCWSRTWKRRMRRTSCAATSACCGRA
jgi:glycyl-tRNA synthetase beta chain